MIIKIFELIMTAFFAYLIGSISTGYLIVKSKTGEDIRTIGSGSTGATNVKSWLKIGFQSRPGVLVVINQQPIRVGRSGIYQINNGTPITSFMITAPGGADNSKIDAFLLDYAYNSGGN